MNDDILAWMAPLAALTRPALRTSQASLPASPDADALRSGSSCQSVDAGSRPASKRASSRARQDSHRSRRSASSALRMAATAWTGAGGDEETARRRQSTVLLTTWAAGEQEFRRSSESFPQLAPSSFAAAVQPSKNSLPRLRTSLRCVKVI